METKCIWFENCPYNDECDYCDYNDEENICYISKEEFYKDWFEYIERADRD